MTQQKQGVATRMNKTSDAKTQPMAEKDEWMSEKEHSDYASHNVAFTTLNIRKPDDYQYIPIRLHKVIYAYT